MAARPLKDERSQAADTAERQRSVKRFEAVLQSAMVAIFAAGAATMQSRQLLIAQAAKPLGEEAVLKAISGLATAFSLGSFVEMLVSPSFGTLSDRVGRARVIGIQPTVAIASTMISDVFPATLQPNAHSRLKAAQALGLIIGNYASGWWNTKVGPQSTYVLTASVPVMCIGYLAYFLPESHPVSGQTMGEVLPSSKNVEAGHAENKVVQPARSMGALRTVFGDPQCCLLAAVLGLYEFMAYAPMNTVSILFMKERLGWGPLEAGRFASGVALATFSGSLLVARIRRVMGEVRERLYVTAAHALSCLAYALWGTASGARGMVGCLLPMALGAGANPVILTRFQRRAQVLGLGRGEATAVQQTVGAAARMVAPQLFMRLWQRASAQRAARTRAALPLGAPMLSVGVVAAAQELLHQASHLI